MKKKILLSSIATIVLCACLIAGSTYALFTSQAQLNVAVTSGKVEINAKIVEDSLKLSSIRGVKAGESEKYVDDPVLHERFYYVEESQRGNTFANGGTAKVDNGTLVLDRITPGDKVTFQISTSNASNVSIKSRVILKTADGVDTKLAEALKVHISGDNLKETGFTPENGSFVSSWVKYTAKQDLGTYVITVELPAIAGNDYQGQSIRLAVILEAIQDNAIAD